MTGLSVAHGAINLSQGFPDFPAPEEIKEAARRAIADEVNQYPIAAMLGVLDPGDEVVVFEPFYEN
jgi:aminotransferase